MALSIQEQLLTAITAAVGGEYGVTAPTDDDELPVTVVDEGPDSAEDVYGSTNIELPVVVARAETAVSKKSELIRRQANAAKAELIRLMFVDETFGGLADGIDYTGGEIQAEVGSWVFASASFNVRFHHVRGDPLTQDEI